jgi:hypothetical protein
MINSPEVCLCIKKLYPEVDHKKIFIFIYKNHLDRFSINTKQFIINDLHNNFVHFLV